MIYITTEKNEQGEDYVFSIGKSDYPPKGAIVVPRIVPTGSLVSHFDDNWRKKPLSVLVEEELIKVPDGCKVEGEDFVEMSLSEKVNSGFLTIPKGLKLEGEELVPKSLKEQFDSEEISLEEWAEKIRTQRNFLFTETIWLVERYEEQKTLGLETDNDEYLKVLRYREYLRNVPQEENFPKSFSTFKTLNDF